MGDDDAETLCNVIRGRFTFDYPEFDAVSADARDIINKLLVTDKRYDNISPHLALGLFGSVAASLCTFYNIRLTAYYPYS